MALARTNVTLPEDLLREVDELAGPRGRSQFVADAVTSKVKRERLRKALDASRGVFVGTKWQMTPDEAYRWVEDGIDTANEQQAKNTYVVQEGETLWSIAEKEYKDGYAWSEIAEANTLTNPDNLEAGTQLVLPERDTVATAGTEQDTQATTSPTLQATSAPTPSVMPQQEQMQTTGEKITGAQYTIVAGDTLWDISIRAYGNGYRWPEIAQANTIVNPNLIFVGTTLNLQR